MVDVAGAGGTREAIDHGDHVSHTVVVARDLGERICVADDASDSIVGDIELADLLIRADGMSRTGRIVVRGLELLAGVILHDESGLRNSHRLFGERRGGRGTGDETCDCDGRDEPTWPVSGRMHGSIHVSFLSLTFSLTKLSFERRQPRLSCSFKIIENTTLKLQLICKNNLV